MTTILAPAKLTLSLAVTGVRADGLHELSSEMVSLALCDELTLNEGAEGLTIDAAEGTRAQHLPEERDNLIGRALAAAGRSASVHLRKVIPLGGGLGGGSTDAGAVLRWAGCDDVEVALALGSDVPFCLTGGRALVEGVGERVTPLPFEERHFLLVVPPFGVDTGRVYAAWDQLESEGRPSGNANQLTAAALVVEPRLGAWRDALGDFAGRQPTLAGSGSTWFVEVDAGEFIGETGVLTVVHDEGRLIRTSTVPSGWDG
jgi:4-diphosphocytidyl-2-C-methyl-D-erythritol kinase